MIERLNVITFNFTFVVKSALKSNPNNRLINKDLKKQLEESIELKQAFIKLLFKYAFENINKCLKPPKEILEAKKEYLSEIDVVKQFLDEHIIKTENEKDKINVKTMFEIFKRKIESDVSFREFSKALERHGFTKSKIKGIIYIKQIKLNIDTNDVDFID